MCVQIPVSIYNPHLLCLVMLLSRVTRFEFVKKRTLRRRTPPPPPATEFCHLFHMRMTPPPATKFCHLFHMQGRNNSFLKYTEEYKCRARQNPRQILPCRTHFFRSRVSG